MPVHSTVLRIESKPETDLIDITEQISGIVKKSGINSGIVTIFVKGSTASVSTIEYEPNLVADFKDAMERLIPSDIKYRHTETWGDDNGKSHIRATFMGPSLTVPFKDGQLLLGTWQQIVLCDFDVPARSRELVVQIIGE